MTLTLKPAPTRPTILTLKVYQIGRKPYDLILKCKTYEVIRK